MSTSPYDLGSLGDFVDPTYLDPNSSDLSTEYANPNLNNTSGTNWMDAISQIGSVAGQWGTTIASVVTGNPVASVQSPNGTIQPVGAAGSYVSRPGVLSSNPMALLLLIGGVILVIYLLRD